MTGDALVLVERYPDLPYEVHCALLDLERNACINQNALVSLRDRMVRLADEGDKRTRMVDGRWVEGVVWSAQIRNAVESLT